MFHLGSDEKGTSLVELLGALALLTGLILVSTLSESGLARQRIDAKWSTNTVLQLQQGLTAIATDIHRAWFEPPPEIPSHWVPPTGNLPVSLSEPVDGCSEKATLIMGPNTVTWSLIDGKLVRTMNGKPSNQLGTYDELCFEMDSNDRTVLITLKLSTPDGKTRTLQSAATPGGDE